jgi:hypothetical protein
MSSRNIESLLRALSNGEGFKQPDEAEVVLAATTTIDEQLARGLVEIESLKNLVANEASLQFGKDLINFLADQSRKLGLSGYQFGNTFGYAAELHQKVDQGINENLPQNASAGSESLS